MSTSSDTTSLSDSETKLWTPAFISLIAIISTCVAACILFVLGHYFVKANRIWRRRKEPTFVDLPATSAYSQKDIPDTILPLFDPETPRISNKLRKSRPGDASIASPYTSFDDTSPMLAPPNIGPSSNGRYLQILTTPPRTSSLTSEVLNTYPFDPSYYNKYSPTQSPRHQSRASSRADLEPIAEEHTPEVHPLPIPRETSPLAHLVPDSSAALSSSSRRFPTLEITEGTSTATTGDAEVSGVDKESDPAERYSWTPADNELESLYAPSRRPSTKSSRKSKPSSPVSPLDVPPLPTLLNTISDPGPNRRQDCNDGAND